MQNTKKYDLEERTLDFAKRVNQYVNNLPKKYQILKTVNS